MVPVSPGSCTHPRSEATIVGAVATEEPCVSIAAIGAPEGINNGGRRGSPTPCGSGLISISQTDSSIAALAAVIVTLIAPSDEPCGVLHEALLPVLEVQQWLQLALRFRCHPNPL